jgi:hypothetical protein
MDATSVAALLRYARGIDRQTVGNFMGKADDFNAEARSARLLPTCACSQSCNAHK